MNRPKTAAPIRVSVDQLERPPSSRDRPASARDRPMTSMDTHNDPAEDVVVTTETAADPAAPSNTQDMQP